MKLDASILHSIPADVIESGRRIELWFANRGIMAWAMGGLACRSEYERLLRENKALRAQLAGKPDTEPSGESNSAA